MTPFCCEPMAIGSFVTVVAITAFILGFCIRGFRRLG